MIDLIDKTLAGRYKIESYIDKGGMSYIYKAWDVNAEKYLAIKVLKEEFCQNEEFATRFDYEALAFSKMNHPNIVSVTDVGNEDIKYICMEYIDGKTLTDIIKERGSIESNLACEITIRILSALHHAHSKGIIHRDIKPQNILIDNNGMVKVTDFGIARISSLPGLTGIDIGIGTVQYVSPEQALGKAVESTSDLYSLGIVMYEMLTGQLPFTGETALEIAMKQINDKALNLREVNHNISRELEAVVKTAMQKDVANRYATAVEMESDIRMAMEGKYPEIAKSLLKEDPVQQDIAALVNENKEIKQEIKTETKVKVLSPEQKLKLKKKRKRKIIFAVVFVACLLASIFWGISWLSRISSMIYVPDVEGMNFIDAIGEIHSLGLKPQVNYTFHNSVPTDIVISQEPKTQEIRIKGDIISLNVSKGKENLKTPDLKGLSLDDAIKKASETGISITVVEKVVSSEYKEGLIISQNPEFGQEINRGDLIQVRVSGGSVVIPQLIGMKQDEAIKHLEGMQLQCGEISFKDIVKEDQNNKVLTQIPKPGTMVVSSTKVDLSIGILVSDYITSTTFSLPKMNKSFLIRIVLVGNNGEESPQYMAMHSPTSSSDTTITVPVKSKESGIMYCNLYINDILTDTVEVSLQ